MFDDPSRQLHSRRLVTNQVWLEVVCNPALVDFRCCRGDLDDSWNRIFPSSLGPMTTCTTVFLLGELSVALWDRAIVTCRNQVIESPVI